MGVFFFFFWRVDATKDIVRGFLFNQESINKEVPIWRSITFRNRSMLSKYESNPAVQIERSVWRNRTERCLHKCPRFKFVHEAQDVSTLLGSHFESWLALEIRHLLATIDSCLYIKIVSKMFHNCPWYFGRGTRHPLSKLWARVRGSPGDTFS